MIRRALLGILCGILAGIPSRGEGAPSRMVVLREGASPRPAAGILPPSDGTAPATWDLRPFPHDLGRDGPGLPPAPRTLAGILASRTGPAAPAAVRPLRLAVFRVDFLEDGAGDQSTGNGRFDLRRGVSGIPVDPPPHDRAYFEAHAEALRRYYAAQSYGELQIETTVFPAEPESAFHLSDTADYGPWEVSQNPDVVALAERFVGDAIRAVDDDPANVDFASFDAFVVVHAGADFQGDVGRDTPYDIPSFTISLAEPIPVNGGTSEVGRVLVLPETASQDDRIAALNGVFAHEFGHVLGLVDLYNIFNGVPQVGYWSLMDSGENIAAIVEDPDTGEEFIADGIFPTSLDPWSKLQIFPQTVVLNLVEEVWEGDLAAVETDPGIPLVLADGLEYFLVENRALDLDGNGFPFVQQDSTTGVFLGPVDDPDRPGAGGRLEYDAVLPGGGLLIWHIDDRLAVPGFANGAPNFRTGLRGIALEEADGIWDQGRFNFGSPYDPFFVGNHSRFAPETVPDTGTNDGAQTGIVIETTSRPGPSMQVRVERSLAVEGWPLVFSQSEQVSRRTGPLTLADVTGDGTPEIVFELDAAVEGIPVPRRTLVTIGLDGVPVGDTVLVELDGRLRGGLAASDDFWVSNDASAPVVAATVATGQVFLWHAVHGFDLLDGRGTVNAVTAPVLWQPGPGKPGAVLTAGIGTFQVVNAADARVDTAQASAGAPPVAGPVLIPGVSRPGGGSEDFAAVAYEGVGVEFFALAGGITPPAPVLSPASIRALMSGWISPEEPGPSLALVSAESIEVYSPRTERILAGWPLPHPQAVPPVLGDLDGDARAEIALADTAGEIRAWNGDGSPALGWPKRITPPVRNLRIADIDGDGRVDLVALDGDGRFHAWTGRGEPLAGYPRALGPYDVLDAVLERFERGGPGSRTELLWLASTEGAALAALKLGESSEAPGEWRYTAGTRGRGHFLAAPSAPSPAETAPELEEPLFAYPNPARDWVEFRYLLAEGESAILDVLDVAGRRVEEARLIRHGEARPGENAVRWDLSGMAPGIFLCRLERSGPGGTRVDFTRVVVVR